MVLFAKVVLSTLALLPFFCFYRKTFRTTLTYKVKIPVADLREIKTFDNLYDYIESHAKQE